MAQSQKSPRSDTSSSGAPDGKARASDANRSSTTDDRSGGAGDVVHQAQDQAGQLIGQARQQATTQLASQKERAASTLGVLASALHEASRQVREQDDATMAGYIDNAAGQIDALVETLGQQDIGQLLDSASRYARRQPAVFLAGAIAVGFLGARFLKSSSQGASRSMERSGYGAYVNRSSDYGDAFGAGYAGGPDRAGYGGSLSGAEGGLGYGSSSAGMGLDDYASTAGSGSAAGGDWQTRPSFGATPEGS